jgi:hypothetical protein
MNIMIVKIMMDKVPSTHNKILMEFLLKNVTSYRDKLQMSIVTISKSQHKSLDAKVTALPAAYIGSNIVVGYKNIIEAMKSASNQVAIHVNNDPVQSFWDKNIQQGMGKPVVKKSEDEDISARFTAATKNRTAAYESRAPRFKNAPKSGQSSAPSKKNKGIQSNAAPTTTAERMMQNDADVQLDVDDPTALETDPIMKMFWANQTTTPGI